MKKLLLLLMLPFFTLAVNAQCDYEVELWDSWGDGWNGGTLQVLIDGVASGPALTGVGESSVFPISVLPGDTITFTYTAGGSPAENAWQLRDATGAIVHTEGGSFNQGGTGSNNGGVAPAAGSGPAIGFEATCPPCVSPGAVSTSFLSTDSVILNWAASSTAGATYNWEIQPSGSPQGTPGSPASGATGSTSVNTGPVLSSATDYVFYVQSDCSTDSSVFVSLAFTTLSDYCGGDNFYDNGGAAGNYATGSNDITTIFPDMAGDVVTATFNSFDVEATWDGLTIYDGPSTAATSLGTFDNSAPPTAPFLSTHASGALTFEFTSDAGGTNAGFDATITCAPAPTCSSPENQTVSNIMTTSVVLDWDTGALSGTQWYVEYDTAGFTQGMGTSVSVMTFDSLLLTGLTADTQYDWYVLADCGADSSVWLGPNTFTTSIDFCGVGVFYDNGGAAGDYSANANDLTTIFPDMAGDVVTVVFNSFDVEATWDGLTIYDGPSTASTNLGTFDNNTPPTAPFTSTDASGALTFEFTSDAGGAFAGWDASVNCGPPPTCDVPANLAEIDITDVSAVLDWDTGAFGGATQWFVEWDTAGFTPGMGTTVSVMTFDSLLLTGLMPNTSYDWYISSYCGPMDTSIVLGPNNFGTNPAAPMGVTCVTAGANPTPLFYDDFEAGLTAWTGTFGAAGSSQANWNTNSGPTGSGNTGPNAAFSGTEYIFFEGSTAGTATAVSPAIDLTGALDDAELSFMMHAFGAEMGTFTVGVGTAAAGPFTTEFTFTGELQTSSADAWVPVGVDLSAYIGSTIFIELTNVTTLIFSSDMSIDSMVVSACATCVQPTAGVSTPTFTSAHIEWDGSGSPFGLWEVEFGPTGFTQGTGTILSPTASDPIGIGVGNDTAKLTPLTTATTYDWYVVNVCNPGADTSSAAGPFTFTTLADYCGADNFYDNGGAAGNYAGNSNDVTSIFPDMAGDVVTVTFNTFDVETTWDGLTIYDGPTTGATNLGTFDNGNPPPGPITSTDASGALTFEFTSDGFGANAGFDATIDCGPPPTCFQATDLTVDGNSFTSADLSWTPGATGTPNFVLEYGLTGFTQGTGTFVVIATDTFTTITGLTPETSYDWYVKDSCSVGDAGPWSSVSSFYTGYCIPPYTGGTSDGDLISNVVITGTTLSNNTGTVQGTPSYTYYNTLPNHTADLQAGTSYDVVVSNGAFGSQNMAAWIDFNDDLIFDASERIGFTASPLAANSTATFTVSLPCNPAVGLHRLRIRDEFGGASGAGIEPCDQHSWGETEDYDVTVLAPPPCPEIASLALFGTITTTTADFDWETGCTETMWDYEVNTSMTPPTGAPTNVMHMDTFVNATGLMPGTTYYAHVRANCGGGDVSTWNTISFTTNSLPAVNDSLSGAIAMLCGDVMTENTDWSTSDAAQGVCAGGGTGGAPGIGVWYSFIGTGEEVQVSLCNSNFDTELHIYSGPNADTCIISNDDNNALCGGGNTSSETFTSVMGTQYYFLASGFGANTGDIEISVTCIPVGATTWLGNSNDYSSGTNWSSGLVPTCADDIFVPLTANDPVINGAFACNDFGTSASVTTDVTITGTLGICGDVSLANSTTISGAGVMSLDGTNGGASFDVVGSASVSNLALTSDYAFSGDLTISDGIVLTSGDMDASAAVITLESSATGTAYLDDFTGTGAYTGNITVENFVTNGSGLGQRFFGTAVDLGIIQGLDQTYATGYPLGQVEPDVCNVSLLYTSAYSNIFKWREDSSFPTGCEQSGWWAIDQTATLKNARGYSGWMNDGSTLTVTGAPNTGNVIYVTTGTTGNAPAGFDGWHLVSNPYPSPLNVSAFTGSGFTSPQLYDGTSGPFYGTFTPAALAGTLGSMQGVFAESTGSGTLTTTNADRVASNAVAFTSTSTLFDQMLTIDVQGNGFGDKTYLYYSDNSSVTVGFDDLGDCKKRSSDFGQPTIYTSLGSQRMSLNGYPESSMGQSVPMGIDHSADGSFELGFEGMTNFPANTTIYVEDMQEGVYHNIANGNYAYTALASDNSDRFMIHFVLPIELATVNVNCAGDQGKIELVTTTGIVDRDFVITEATTTVATGALSTLNASVDAGTYDVTVNDAFGGNQTYTVTVEVDEAIEALYTVSAIDVQVGEVVSFNNTTLNTTGVEWNIADITTITGVNNATYSFDEVGTYVIELMVSNDDCSDVKTFEVNVSNKTTSVTTLSKDNLIKVYSNEDVVTIAFENNFNANAKVEIQNVIGQKVFAGTVTAEGTQTIQIEDVTTGYYFVSVEVEGEKLSSKVFLTKK